MPIYKPSELHGRGFRPKKSLSQNFLIDRNIIEKICKTADVTTDDSILEIGPGPGALTEFLLKGGANVIAVEKDKNLANNLMKEFPTDHLQVVEKDALDYPYQKLPSNTKVVANLPYHITTPIIERLIPLYPTIQSLTIMVQKEVGERMTAKVNTSQYSSFTVFLQAFAKVSYAFTVKPSSFYPQPSVHSCVVHLKLCRFPFAFDQNAFFTFTRRAFQQRRKMLRSSLKGGYPVEKLGEFATKRPQELSLGDFATLFEQIQTHREPNSK